MNILNRSVMALAAAAALAVTAGCFQVESRPGTTYRIGSASSGDRAATAIPDDNRPTSVIAEESRQLRQQAGGLEKDYSRLQTAVQDQEKLKSQLKRDRDDLKKDRDYWKKQAKRD